MLLYSSRQTKSISQNNLSYQCGQVKLLNGLSRLVLKHCGPSSNPLYTEKKVMIC